MLTLEAPQYTIKGIQCFRDHADNSQFWYLPSSRVRVSDGGRGLSFVAYSEDITNDPNFSLGADHAGGFLTLEVELGPSPEEVQELSSELAGEAGVSEPKLAQVPFTDGQVTLSILGDRGAGEGTAGANGFQVQTVGSTKPSLFGRQTAVFSSRLGGKAAEILFNTLRQTQDPQAVVNYDLKFKALSPAYNLEIEVDFKSTFESMRHRVGLNLLVAKSDLDFLIQDAVNSGSIVVREIDFAGNASTSSPLAAEGGVMKLIRDLIAPTLFNPAPIPTPDYRALPDSATAALTGESASSSNSVRLSSASTESGVARKIEAGSDIKITHTPVAGGRKPGAEIPVAAKVQADGVGKLEVKLFFRAKGSSEYVAKTMAAPAAPADGVTHEAAIPSQARGTTVEYYLEAKGSKGDKALTQTVPDKDAKKKPLSFRVGAAEDTRTRSFEGVADIQSTTLIGYSLRSVDVSEQVKRTFKLNRQTAITQSYYPAGALSANAIGPAFDASRQITHVRLGEGPFKEIVLRFRSGFDYDAHHILAATVNVTYGRRQDGSDEPLHELTVRLTKASPDGQVQFLADDFGTQSYDYRVVWTYDPDQLVGADGSDEGIRSALIEGETSRDVTVELDRHSPVIPVTVRTGNLIFNPQVLRQVQVRVAPSETGEGRTVQLDAPSSKRHINVVPAAGSDRYFMEQTFFFRDDSTTLNVPDARDSEVFVNEPDGVVFRMRPQFVDPYNLVERVLVDALYRHEDGEEERATLQLDNETKSNEFSVVRRPGDLERWSAAYRFVMKSGPPVSGPTLSFDIPQPFVGLTAAGLRVVRVELLDTALFEAGDVLAVRSVLGANPEDPAVPSATVLLRASTVTASTVVPGIAADGPVQARIEVLRRGAAPSTSTSSLSAFEDTLFLFF